MKETNQKKKKFSIMKVFEAEAQNIINHGDIHGRRRLIIDKYSKELFQLIVYYFTSNSKFNDSKMIKNKIGGDLEKGLYIYGDCGIGKTLSFRTINSIAMKYKIYKSKFWFKMFSAYDIVTEYNMHGDKSLIPIFSGSIYIDDVGSEPIGNYFGKREVLTQILEKRYRLFMEKNLKSFITSNLSPGDFAKRYGKRNADRMFEMYNIINLNGSKSYRN